MLISKIQKIAILFSLIRLPAFFAAGSAEQRQVDVTFTNRASVGVIASTARIVEATRSAVNAVDATRRIAAEAKNAVVNRISAGKRFVAAIPDLLFYGGLSCLYATARITDAGLNAVNAKVRSVISEIEDAVKVRARRLAAKIDAEIRRVGNVIEIRIRNAANEVDTRVRIMFVNAVEFANSAEAAARRIAPRVQTGAEIVALGAVVEIVGAIPATHAFVGPTLVNTVDLVYLIAGAAAAEGVAAGILVGVPLLAVVGVYRASRTINEVLHPIEVETQIAAASDAGVVDVAVLADRILPETHALVQIQ